MGAARVSHKFLNYENNMTDPILYLSMFLGLMGIYVLVTSFSDDDDDSNDDGERYIHNLEYLKLGRS